MKLILLSGGSGKRLWPLSNDTRSKQFLKVLRNEKNLNNESMVQRVWRQIKSVGLDESTVIATSYNQRDMIYNQVGNYVPLIVEPERRDTFPAIALSALYLLEDKSLSEDEIVVVLPVDPYVEIGFFQKIKELECVLKDSKADLALIGVKPTYASSKYGYIIPKDINEETYFPVEKFIEKPQEEEAKALIENNAYWNAGIFAFKLSYLKNILLSKGHPIEYKKMLENYKYMPQISFDYEILERTNNIVATTYNGYWKDLGTWNTLTDEMNSNIVGKGKMSKDSKNTHIINELDITIATLGVENLVVAASPDGILVTEKSASPKIKELIKGLEQRPMFEEKRWGRYQVVDYEQYEDGNEMLTKRLTILEGENISYQYHLTRDEIWNVIKGQGELVLNDEVKLIYPGDVIKIGANSKHSLKATTNMEIIEVQTGVNLVESDNNRVLDKWEDIQKRCLAINET